AHFLAALGAYLFARDLGCRDVAALIAAAGFTCATSIAFFILWPLGLAWIFLPLVLLGLRRASFGLLTCAFTLLLLAGHPETALHIVVIAGAYVLTLRSRRAILTAIASGLTALALTAIFLLPILEAAPQTMEHATRTATFANTPRGASNEQVLARIATDVVPYLHARKWTFGALPADTNAVGSIILALAIYAVWRVRRAESWFFAGVAVFGLLAHAEWPPVARALQKLPLLDVALNERFSFAAAFAFVMLAALGVEEFLRRDDRRGLAITLFATLIVISAGNYVASHSTLVNHDAPEWGRFVIAAEVAGLALALLAIATRRAAPLLLGVLLIQRVFSVGGIYHSFEQSAAYPPIPIFESLRTIREPFRIAGHGLAFIPGTSAMYGLEDVRGYQAMTFRRYHETYPLWSIHQPVWFNRVDDLTRPFLSFLNVRYAITWDRDPPQDGWREAARQPGTLLFENTRVIERVFLPRRVRIGESAQNTLAQMSAESDFRERAWIEADAQPYERDNGPGRVTFTQSLRSFDIAATMERDGWIVVSVPAWKGWRATVDGRRVKTQFANHAFVGIHVPAGTHRVELEYLPRGFVIGRAISGIAIALLILYCIFSRRFSKDLIRPSLR
ncbi:MAG TPA: YfhO family protein, partial [Thermoanaerobaculia bacterium]